METFLQKLEGWLELDDHLELEINLSEVLRDVDTRRRRITNTLRLVKQT
jgi:hypothetical protein